MAEPASRPAGQREMLVDQRAPTDRTDQAGAPASRGPGRGERCRVPAGHVADDTPGPSRTTLVRRAEGTDRAPWMIPRKTRSPSGAGTGRLATRTAKLRSAS